MEFRYFMYYAGDATLLRALKTRHTYTDDTLNNHQQTTNTNIYIYMLTEMPTRIRRSNAIDLASQKTHTKANEIFILITF